MVLTANASFWRLLFRENVPGLKGWLFAASVAVTLTGMHLFLLRVLSPGRSARWVVGILVLVATVAGWYMDTYGIAIDTAMLRNVVRTDVSEARDLLSLSLLWRICWQAVIPIVLLWHVRLPLLSWPKSLRGYALGVSAGLAVAIMAGLPMYSHYVSLVRNQDAARYLVTPANVVVGSINLVRKTIQARQPFVSIGLDARRRPVGSTKPFVLVLVVGETARAANFSLGGYARDTNPELRQRDVLYFGDVASCGTATAVSVPCMFSELPRGEFELSKAAHRENILDVLKRAGVSVTWIENQAGCQGVCARVENRRVGGEDSALCSDGECLDGALLEALPDELSDVSDSSLIVLHAMGSHGPAYYRRVPKAFERFGPICSTERIETCSKTQIVNTYDNSIAYSDHILAGMIDELATLQESVDSVFLYVSDHGESLGDSGLYLHAQPYVIAPSVQKKVPMLLWFSSGAITRLNLDTSCLRAKLNDPASHDNVSHTLLGALDVATEIYRPTLDLLRGCRNRPDGSAEAS